MTCKLCGAATEPFGELMLLAAIATASLQALAKKLGRHFAGDGGMLHAFTTELLDSRWMRVVAKQRRARRLLKFARERAPLT